MKKNVPVEDLKKKGWITNYNDVTGGVKTSPLFPFMIRKFGKLLNPDDDSQFTKNTVRKKRVFHPIIKILGPMFLSTPIRIERRQKNKVKEPVIYMANHCFKDDTLASIIAANRHAYFLMGSVPVFYNTLDGITAFFNGVVLVNRKNKASKQSSTRKCCEVLKNGADLLIFPEGVWNKTPNELILDLWPGIYRVAKETHARVVPIVHYIEDETVRKKNNRIHTVVGEPIRIDEMDEKEALVLLRDIMASVLWKLMEKYGQSTRKKELTGYSSADEAWEERLNARCKPVKYYDKEIEFTADYHSNEKIRPEDAFAPIANIKYSRANKTIVAKARQIIKCERQVDFQHRF